VTTWFPRNGGIISLSPPHFYFILSNKIPPYLSLTGQADRPQRSGSLAGIEYTFCKRRVMMVWLQHFTLLIPLLHTMVQNTLRSSSFQKEKTDQ